MTTFVRYNDRFPTDPYQALAVILAILWMASQLTADQAQALTAIGVIAELALHALRFLQGRR